MVNKTAEFIVTIFAVAFLLFSVALILDTRINLLTGYTSFESGINNYSSNETDKNLNGSFILRDFQSVNSEQNIYGITLLMKNSIINDKVKIEEKLLDGVELIEWNIIGTVESMADVQYSNQNGLVTWEFNSSRNNPILNYKARIPKNSKPLKFEATYFVKDTTMGITSDYLNPDIIAQKEDNGNSALSIDTNSPSLVSFDSPDYPLATFLALGSVILILIVAILLVSMKNEGSKIHSRKDLHLTIHNAMQLKDKSELKNRYLEVLNEYNSKNEKEKHEYYNEVATLYDFVLKSK